MISQEEQNIGSTTSLQKFRKIEKDKIHKKKQLRKPFSLDKQKIQVDISTNNSQKFKILHPEKLLKQYDRILFIPGDYFLNLDFRKMNSLEDQIQSFQPFKKVTKSIQKDLNQQIHFDIETQNNSSFIPFSIIQQAINSTHDPLLINFLPIISKYYKIIETQTSNICPILSQNLIERRREYQDQFIQNYINTNFKEGDFYQYYKYQLNNATDYFLQFRSVAFSYSLIALLGTDPKSFVNIMMRNGFLEFSDSSHKQLQMLGSMACKLYCYDNKMICHGKTKQTILLTLDGIEIVAELNMRKLKVEYPKELQIDHLPDFQTDVPIIINYKIENNTLLSLMAKRKSNPLFQMQWENEIFGYTLESEVFLEKYYQESLARLKEEKKDTKYTHKLKYYYNDQCGYRIVEPQCSLCSSSTHLDHYLMKILEM